jgi:hypothetical protein
MPTRRLQGQGQRAFLRLTVLSPWLLWLSLGLCAPPALALTGCKGKPAPGRPCTAIGLVACSDPGHAFVCDGAAPVEAGAPSSREAAAWSAITCRGAGGCARRGGADDCDDTLGVEGDPCPRGPPVDYACTADGARALACADGRFGLWRACRGPDGCRVVDGKNVQCDTSLGEDGDPCGQSGAYACSVDRKTMLLCNGAHLKPASSCGGPAGCQVEHDTHRVDCDDSVALEGDPCDQTKRITCSVDHKAELVCTDGRYARKRDCRRTDCRLEGAERSELFCD